MSIFTKPYGTCTTGENVTMYTIALDSGEAVDLLDYGATLHGIRVPGRDGEIADVCLGYSDPCVYASPKGGSMGGTIGRVGNRIGGAAFDLNGKHYALFKNDGENNLHSGPNGFHLRMWQAQAEGNAVTFTLHSPDGDQGYPGDADIKVCYSFTKADGVCTLRIDYSAVSDADTLMNMTNHAYFNLNGKGDVKGHLLKIDARRITQTDEGLIPTGKLICAKEAGLGFYEERRVGECIEQMAQYPIVANANGIDVNYAIESESGAVRDIAWLYSPDSGRLMTVATDQPGVQCYSGQGLHVIGKDGSAYAPYSGICLETQHFPDSIHHPEFAGIVLKAGETYQTTTEYRFSIK